MKLSITLPSANGLALRRTLENIAFTTRCDYEVIVVSPERVHLDRVRWITDSVMLGANAGHAIALPFATGEFVLPFVDDHYFMEGWDEIAFDEFERNEARHPFALGLRSADHVGTVFGIYYSYFPLMRLEAAKYVGWFDPLFRKGFADVDLGFRIWSMNGFNSWSKHRLVLPHPDDYARKGPTPNCTETDMDLFLRRWKPKYGHEWKAESLRDFNRDVLVPEDCNTFSPAARADANNCFTN